jgi:hypothetical protein
MKFGLSLKHQEIASKLLTFFTVGKLKKNAYNFIIPRSVARTVVKRQAPRLGK